MNILTQPTNANGAIEVIRQLHESMPVADRSHRMVKIALRDFAHLFGCNPEDIDIRGYVIPNVGFILSGNEAGTDLFNIQQSVWLDQAKASQVA